MPDINDLPRQYLNPTPFIDCDDEKIRAYARSHTVSSVSAVQNAIRLYYAVRDDIRYDPYNIRLDPDGLRAGYTLKAGTGFCISKAVLLAAVCRAAGIPSRLGFADVKNHLSTRRLRESMETDLFVFHGYTELFLDGRWVKATPAFNRSLCERFQVRPLDFDGKNDSVFHPFDVNGNQHMEYVRDRGVYADVPLDEIVAAFQRHYPRLMEEKMPAAGADFERDAGNCQSIRFDF